MKKVLALFLCLAFICVLSACTIGVIKGGPEWESIEIHGVEYVRAWDADVTTADRGRYLGNITQGDLVFRCYAVKHHPEKEYILCYWDWEGFVYERAAEE